MQIEVNPIQRHDRLSLEADLTVIEVNAYLPLLLHGSPKTAWVADLTSSCANSATGTMYAGYLDRGNRGTSSIIEVK